MPIGDDELAAIVGLMGENVRIIQPPKTSSSDGVGGNDVDCIVDRLDPLWPLRLPSGWRLCQVVHYNFSGFNWWLDRSGDVVLLDSTEDRRGLDSGIPTSEMLGTGSLASPSGRAVYLTQKRLRKSMFQDSKWDEIRVLARTDPGVYTHALEAVYGRRVGKAVAEAGLAGIPPSRELWLAARRAKRMRYALRPLDGVFLLSLNTARVVKRLRRPTGLFVLLAGPDGSGKSLLAAHLLESCANLFRRTAKMHWRIGLLPPLSALLRREAGDASKPHAREPHGKAVSALVLGYYWLDSFVGGWLKLWFFRARTGFVVMERGWWDIAIDPRRYRLQVPERLVRVLGRPLIQPDVVFFLDAPPEVLFSRKAELPIAELRRQMAAWKTCDWKGTDVELALDATRSPDELAHQSRETIVRVLEQRAVSSLNGGWTGFTSRRFRRWALPRGSRHQAQNALRVYQPVTPRGQLAWWAARFLAGTGMMKFFPRGEAPPKEVREALAAHIPPRGTLAVSKSKERSRYVALVMTERGDITAVAKVAIDDKGRRALARENDALAVIAPRLAPPLHAPAVIDHRDSLLLLEPVAWEPRLRPWELPDDVASALGALFGSNPRTRPDEGPTHGDFAPWNLLKTTGGWVVVDWEEARVDGPPFYDVFHFLVQSHTLLNRPSYGALIDGVEGRGRIGRAIAAYAESAGLDASDARQYFDHYLQVSQAGFDWNIPVDKSALMARRRLLARSG